MCGLATLALWKDHAAEPERLKQAIRNLLAEEKTPNQEQRDRAARGIREQAAAFGMREYTLSRLEHAMSQIEPERMRSTNREFCGRPVSSNSAWIASRLIASIWGGVLLYLHPIARPGRLIWVHVSNVGGGLIQFGP